MRESTSPTSTETLLELGRLPWMRGLAVDYAHQAEALAPFYSGHPSNPQAWRDSIARVQAHGRDRETLVAILSKQQEQRGAPAEARRAVERLRDPRTVAVVTGQQAGVAGGPLFTLLKSLTAIRLARAVEEQHGTPAVAVFWIDAEDHDWAEVASLTVLDAENRTRTLTLPSSGRTSHVPVASVRLDAGVSDFVQGVREALPPSEFTDALLADLADAYRPGAGMAEAFGRWLERVLGSRGLILYDCSDVAAKPLAARVFQRELEVPGRTWQLATEAGAALTALGYHAQVGANPDGLALFHLNAERHALRRDGDALVAGDERHPIDDWRRIAREEPRHFSPNVLLRPLVQDAIFPTVAYIGGPSELAYLGQLKGVYAHFGIPMPLVVPRATATLLDSGAARFLAKYDIEFARLQPQDESNLNRLLESQLPPEVETSLADAQHALDERLGAIVSAVRGLDPTLEGAAKSTLGRMQHELRNLHGKVIHAAKKRDETLRRQFVRTRALIFPDGHPQERTLGFLWFLNRYGPAIVDILERDLPRDGSVHAVLTP